MSFNKNLRVAGKHAFLSPSTYSWIDDDEDKLRARYFASQQARLGDEYHVYAQTAIRLRIKQAETGTTLNTYINDAIGFRMEPEIPLYYSDDCFGTTDAIGIRDEILRIHDLKTGISPANMKQLLIYAGIFFLEYKDLFSPHKIRTILRIYQNDTIVEHEPEPSEILMFMSKIRAQAALIAFLREED